MRTIAHISDLHFGRIDPPVAHGLVDDLKLRAPDLLVASGDFTQRARVAQYRQAADYLKLLPKPQLAVPGNHDVPLWNLVRRLLLPLGRYREYIWADLFPEYRDDEMQVLGLNTARSFTRTSGWITPNQIEHLRRRTSDGPPGLVQVLVTHHPFIPPPGKPGADALLHADWALGQIQECGIDLLLAGHLHLSYHGDVCSHHNRSAGRSVLSVQAGTATSTRLRGEPNAYNWITLSKNLITVAVRAWNGRAFEESMLTRYERLEGCWRPAVRAPVDLSATTAEAMPVAIDGAKSR